MGAKLRDLPMLKVVEPERPARTSIDDAALEDLAQSIRDNGLLEPIGVCPSGGGRFEIGYGHRRYLAHRLIGAVTIAALVYDSKEQLHSMRIHENAHREELSAADEAVYYAELFEQLGDTTAVAALVRRPLPLVESRLNLVRGWAPILGALREGKISLGVAQEFNRLEHEADVTFYLDYATRAGCTVRVAREWVSQCQERRRVQGPPPSLLEPSGDVAPAAPIEPGPGERYAAMSTPAELTGSREVVSCMFCHGYDEAHRMFLKYACGGCADTILTKLSRPLSS